MTDRWKQSPGIFPFFLKRDLPETQRKRERIPPEWDFIWQNRRRTAWEYRLRSRRITQKDLRLYFGFVKFRISDR